MNDLQLTSSFNRWLICRNKMDSRMEMGSVLQVIDRIVDDIRLLRWARLITCWE